MPIRTTNLIVKAEEVIESDRVAFEGCLPQLSWIEEVEGGFIFHTVDNDRFRVRRGELIDVYRHGGQVVQTKRDPGWKWIRKLFH